MAIKVKAVERKLRGLCPDALSGSRFNAASPQFKVQGSRFKVLWPEGQSDLKVDDKVINDYEL